jgi:hypothetical protein
MRLWTAFSVGLYIFPPINNIDALSLIRTYTTLKEQEAHDDYTSIELTNANETQVLEVDGEV